MVSTASSARRKSAYAAVPQKKNDEYASEMSEQGSKSRYDVISAQKGSARRTASQATTGVKAPGDVKDARVALLKAEDDKTRGAPSVLGSGGGSVPAVASSSTMTSSVSVVGAVPTSALSSAGQDSSLLLADPGIDSLRGSSVSVSSDQTSDEEFVALDQKFEGDDEYGGEEEVDENGLIVRRPVVLEEVDDDDVEDESDLSSITSEASTVA
jgi:hypothetical protein